MNKAELTAIVTLASSSLRVGSNIDILHGGQFWEAVIVRATRERFRFRFLYSKTHGWVSRHDVLRKWRFPCRSKRDFWKMRLLQRL